MLRQQLEQPPAHEPRRIQKNKQGVAGVFIQLVVSLYDDRHLFQLHENVSVRSGSR